MNEISQRSDRRATTQAAEGLPRWRWTTAELVRLAELGAFSKEDKFELIGGEIVPMAAVGRRHEVVGEDIEEVFRKRATPDFRVVNDRQLNLAEDTFTEPDILVRPAAIRTADMRGDAALLIVEVAQTSLAYDQGLKADLYARFGVREYWVVNAATLVTRVHRAPGPQGYGSKIDVAPNETLTPLLVPNLALRLADLDLG